MLTSLKGPIARGTVRTSVVLSLRLVIQAGTLLLVARALGPHEFGAFAGVAALALILGTLATFGTQLVLLGEMSREPVRRDAVLLYAVPTTFLCGGVLFAIYLLIYALALRETGVAISVLLTLGATETLLQPLIALSAAEHLALGRIARSQLLATLPLALRLTAAALVFLLRPPDPLVAYAYGYIAASLIALAAATAVLPAAWPAFRRWRLPTKGELRNAAGFAALNITGAGPEELDKTLAAKFLPLSASGLYAAGARVIGAATLPVVAMMLSALPRLFREGQGRVQHTTRLLRWIFVAALTYGVVLAAMLWLIAPVFVWLFGLKYQNIDQTIRWLCLAVPAVALRVAAGNVLMALGKPWMRVGFEVMGLGVLIIAAIVLTAHFQITGMPLALASSEWSMTIVGITLVYAVCRKYPRSASAMPEPR